MGRKKDVKKLAAKAKIAEGASGATAMDMGEEDGGWIVPGAADGNEEDATMGQAGGEVQVRNLQVSAPKFPKIKGVDSNAIPVYRSAGDLGKVKKAKKLSAKANKRKEEMMERALAVMEKQETKTAASAKSKARREKWKNLY